MNRRRGLRQGERRLCPGPGAGERVVSDANALDADRARLNYLRVNSSDGLRNQHTRGWGGGDRMQIYRPSGAALAAA